MAALYGYDIDRVMTAGAVPKEPAVIVSGRTFSEFDDVVRALGQRYPTYIRGSGRYGDHEDAGRFKAMMINHLGITEFHEDHETQIAIIRANCPNVTIVQWPR